MNTHIVDRPVPDFSSAEPLFAFVSEMLHQGVATNRHAYHLMTVATLNAEGWPDARVVVLRGWDAAARTLRFHTDLRSPKVQALEAQPRVTLLLYDPVSRVQLRIPALAEVRKGDAWVRSLWERSRPDSRACYAADEAPGEVLATEEPLRDLPLTLDTDNELAFQRFGVVVCTFTRMDVLHLHAGRHRRGRLDWSTSGWQLTRLAP